MADEDELSVVGCASALDGAPAEPVDSHRLQQEKSSDG